MRSSGVLKVVKTDKTWKRFPVKGIAKDIEMIEHQEDDEGEDPWEPCKVIVNKALIQVMQFLASSLRVHESLSQETPDEEAEDEASES